ncbi:hypothetical protein DL98DRAFT_591961 [Cadophora sp. DSE1049]|nr:hypothetical protein DL98DRAFT_591961 [Cadophora sp. DSE1049]
MSTATSSSDINGTVIISGRYFPTSLFPFIIFIKADILHLITVGFATVLVLFTYLHLGSNRSIAPITVFDWVINVALGSSLARIVNGNSFTRRLLAIATMLAFQYITSTLATRFHNRLAWAFQVPPFRRCIFTKKELLDARVKPDVLMAVRAYRKLCEHAEVRGEGGKVGTGVRNGGLGVDTDVEKGDERSRERNSISCEAA